MGSALTIVVSPTGSGKTWVQAIIAKYFCSKDKKVVLVEPNKNLMLQSIFKLEALDFKFHVTTMQNLFEEPIVADVILLNEYDLIVS
jgi:reverse gyrase